MNGINLVLSLIASFAIVSGVSAPDQVSVVMVGDILLHTPVEEAAADADGNYNFDSIFSQTKDYIGAADLALVNQEVIIGGKELVSRDTRLLMRLMRLVMPCRRRDLTWCVMPQIMRLIRGKEAL